MVKSLASKTGQVIYRQKGEPGKPGDKGARLRMREWAAGQSYLRGSAGEEWYDVVLYKDLLYLCVKSHTSSTANNPQTSVANNLGYWEKAQDWTFVATKLLLAERIKAEDIDADNLVAVNVDIEGSIKRGIIVYESGSSFQITPKSNIYVIKNSNALNLVYLFFSLSAANWGTEFSIINGGTGVAKVAYGMEAPFFLFKGKSYTYVKLNKPGDILELVYSPVVSSLSPDTGGVSFIIRNKSDFKPNADGITLDSI